MPDLFEAEGLADLAGGVGVTLGGCEVAEKQVNAGELAQRIRFVRLAVAGLLDPKAFLDEAASVLEGLAGGGFVPRGAGGLAFLLTDDGPVRNLVSVGEIGYSPRFPISWRLTHGCDVDKEG